MRHSCSVVLALAVGLLTTQAGAAPIPVNFVAAIPEFFGPQPLPIEMSGFPNNMRLRFQVPDAPAIVQLHSLTVSVELFDDDDANTREEGDLVFVHQFLGNPNFVFQSFGPGLNGFTFASPLTVTGNIPGGALPDVLAEIQDDGFFLVRVNRNGGDFVVKSASATIDATLIPEPGTWVVGAGLAVLLLARRRRR